MNKLEVTFEWENDDKFEMVSKLNSDDSITIVEAHENGCMQEIWSGIQSVCISYLSTKLTEIGNEMKS